MRLVYAPKYRRKTPGDKGNIAAVMSVEGSRDNRRSMPSIPSKMSVWGDTMKKPDNEMYALIDEYFISENTIMKVNVNGNGKITIANMRMIKRAIDGLITLD